MRLTHLAPFFALVTPESMEQYLKEKGWTRRHANGGYWKGGLVIIPGRPQLADLSFIAAEEGSHTLAVLCDLLPPEHRGGLVKAVFPGLEIAFCAKCCRYFDIRSGCEEDIRADERAVADSQRIEDPAAEPQEDRKP